MCLYENISIKAPNIYPGILIISKVNPEKPIRRNLNGRIWFSFILFLIGLKIPLKKISDVKIVNKYILVICGIYQTDFSTIPAITVFHLNAAYVITINVVNFKNDFAECRKYEIDGKNLRPIEDCRDSDYGWKPPW